MPKLAWRSILGWSLLGSLLAATFVLANVAQTSETLGTLISTRPDSAWASIIEGDLGVDAVRAGGEHDGQHFYMIARDPTDLVAFASMTDRPTYRLGRIGFPALVWLLHPTGGGPGLLWTMFAVGLAGLVLGGVAMGVLSMHLGGRPWPAVVFPLMFGSLISLRISVADALALALALAAVALALRRHPLAAVALACGAALTKESVLLVLVGIALVRRDRTSVAMVVAPGACVAAWQLWLRIVLPDPGKPVDEIGWPFAGLADAVPLWLDGIEPLAPLCVVGTAVLAAAALARAGWRHPLAPALLLQAAFFVLLRVSVVGLERNASRTLLPLTALAVLMLATPRARSLDPGGDAGLEAEAAGQVAA